MGKEKEGASFAYQAEYILEGKDNDLENLRSVANQLLLLRETANVLYLFTDSAKRAEAEGTAALISSVLMLPELVEPLTDVILFAWGYAESVKDLRILFDGEKVPILKTMESWNTPYSQLLTFRGHLQDYPRGQQGLSYRDYLEALLYLKSLDQTTKRMMDVMESDIRLTPGNAAFRMDGCMDGMTARASVSSGYGYQYEIERVYEYIQAFRRE